MSKDITQRLMDLTINIDEACKEIELLRSYVTDCRAEIVRICRERDEARRECCTWQGLDSGRRKHDVAISRDWDCFKEEVTS